MRKWCVLYAALLKETLSFVKKEAVCYFDVFGEKTFSFSIGFDQCSNGDWAYENSPTANEDAISS